MRDCREEAMFNSYVYLVPIPKSAHVQITPGNQQAATLDASGWRIPAPRPSTTAASSARAITA